MNYIVKFFLLIINNLDFGFKNLYLLIRVKRKINFVLDL